MSFFLMGAEERLQNNQLMSLHRLIDWQRIDHLLNRIHKRDWTRGGGPTPYPPVQMFKILLLQHWHQLSDQGVVDSLCVRLDFMLFTGFDLGASLPDESTVCRFRNRLVALGLEKRLFEEILTQLEGHGLSIRQAKMAIVDATIIESASRPRRCIDLANDREETTELNSHDSSDASSTNHQIIESSDPDARWLKKGKRSFFGYKGFVTVEPKQGFILGLHATPANRSEMKELETAVQRAGDIDLLLGDKGYASQKNRDWLAERKITSGIMYRAAPGKSLDEGAKYFNRVVSQVRWKVEQCFGTLKRRFGMQRARYRSLEKVESELWWKAICFNLLKAERMLKA